MLKKINRLRNPILRNARTVSSDSFLLRIRPNDKSILRMGVVVSKKVDKRATERNRLKRVIREAVREKLNKVKEGVDISFVLKKNPPSKNNTLLKEAEKILKENL